MMNKVSKALQEVWDMKEACYQEIKDLPLEEALRKRIEDSLKTTKELGFKLSSEKSTVIK